MPPVESNLMEFPFEKHFDLLCKANADGNISISKYRSKRTGLTVVIGDVKGPIINGLFSIATEAHDNDGIPHTLEHLVFMGSEDYPYKGVLDQLANRCFAAGTNAETGTDRTSYKMNTAGSEGFLNLLPIYLDHILYPTLSDEAFITEVHHVNGEGEDGGIVYCEMQGRENDGEELCVKGLLKAMYPGHCGYKSQTGGIMKNLRESTTNEKIKNYQKAFYRPENLCLIITGQIDPVSVFRAIHPIEEKILRKGERPKCIRPWQSPVPPLEGSVDLVIPYPCDDDEHGLVYAAWRGPHISNPSEILALSVLQDYLTDTSVSPLQQEFVEIDDPYCSEISASTMQQLETVLTMQFASVPKEKLHLIKPKLQETLQKLVAKPETFDMKRMGSILHCQKLQLLSIAEENAHQMIGEMVTLDFLYGHSNEDLLNKLQQIPILNSFFEKKVDFWLNLIKKYMIDGFMVLIVGEASPSLLKTVTETEKARVAATRQALGEDGMKKKKEILQKAIAKNGIKTPESVLRSVKIPGTSSIHFHSVKRSCSYMDNKDTIDGFPLSNLPCRFQLDDLQSVFVKMDAFVDTSSLSSELRLYLALWIELILESPLLRNGKIIPYEDVIAELSEDTIENSACLGFNSSTRFFCGSHAQVVSLTFQVEQEKYQKGVTWLKEVLTSSQFVADRINVVAKKMINDVSTIKRNGSNLMTVMMRNISFQPKSNHWASSALRQLAFLTKLLQKLEAQPQQVIGKLEELRRALNESLTIHMSADVKSLSKLADPRKPWTENFQQTGIVKSNSQPQPCYELLQPLDCGLPTGVILGIGSVESTFLLQSAPVDISYTHPDVPALLVLMNYLTQLEGPMWKQIRGLGLAYSYSIFVSLDEKQMYFMLDKSTNIARAYQESKMIVENHISGATEWNEPLFDSGRSSLMFEIINREKSLPKVSNWSVFEYFRNLSGDYNRNLLDLVSKVQMKDLGRVGQLYLTPLFDASKSRCSICCNPSKVQETVANFQGMSRKLDVVKSLEDDLLSKFDI